MRFLALCFALLFCTTASAVDWELHPPSRDPMRFGYATGTYTNPQIREGGIAKKWLNENDRHTYIEIPAGVGQNWGSLDNRTTVLNTRQRMVGYKGAIALTTSTLRANWDYIPNGQTLNRPKIELVWSIENKCSAPESNPPITAEGYGAVSGSINNTIRRINADPNQQYQGLFRIEMKADYEDATEEATTTPARYASMQFKAGNSHITAVWNGVKKKYDVTRKTRTSNGTFYEKTYEFALPMHFAFSCYPRTTNSTWAGQTYKVITYEGIVGKAAYPQNSPGWEDIAIDCTSMKSTAYPPNVTGDDVRDEKWSGSIKIQPRFEVKH